MPTKIQILSLFTKEEIATAKTIIKKNPMLCNKELVDSVVKQAMPRIDLVTGQKNDERYFAYALEYALT